MYRMDRILLVEGLCDGTHTEFADTEYGLAEDAGIHFARAKLTVDENDWILHNPEAQLICLEFHLDLEGITLEFDSVEIDSFEHLAAVAYESGGAVAQSHACDCAHISRCEIRHQHASHRPVDHVYTRDIARSHTDIRSFILACMVEVGEVGGIMREVGIHLDDKLIVAFQSPLESVDIGCAQTEFAASALQIDASGVLTHLSAHGIGRAVRRPVINYEKIESVRELHDGIDHFLDILNFIVGRYDNKRITHKYLSLGRKRKGEGFYRAIFVANIQKNLQVSKDSIQAALIFCCRVSSP